MGTRRKKLASALPGIIFIIVAASVMTFGFKMAMSEQAKTKTAEETKAKEEAQAKEAEKDKAEAEAKAKAEVGYGTETAEKPAETTTPAEPAAKTATTKSFVRFRESMSTSSTVLAELDAGTVVTLGDEATSTWQQATYNGQTGYIYKTYLTY